MKKYLLAFILLGIVACRPLKDQDITSPVITPEPTETAEVIAVPTKIVEITSTPDVQISLPHSLFFLVDNRFWVLFAETNNLKLFFDPKADVTSFDIWGDGKALAYSTVDGQVYIMRDGQEPHLYHDMRSETEKEFLIEGL